MPRVIEIAETGSCSPEECIAALHATGFDPRDEDSLMNAARWLKRLAANRKFLADRMIAELTGEGAPVEGGNYSPQVIMLSPPGGAFFLRANIWPSADEASFRASGGGSFVYGLPHDHDFDFLTVGYFGPGYWSDYYEYDYGAVSGAVGEKAGLRFVERSRLEESKVMHYRAHRDVHAQLPPDSLSVSINVMHAGGAQGWMDQYSFDVENDLVANVLGRSSAEAFLRIAVGLGSEDALDLAECFARAHPSDRMRLSALEAQAGMMELAARDTLWRRAEGSGSRLVALEATRRRAALALALA